MSTLIHLRLFEDNYCLVGVPLIYNFFDVKPFSPVRLYISRMMKDVTVVIVRFRIIQTIVLYILVISIEIVLANNDEDIR